MARKFTKQDYKEAFYGLLTLVVVLLVGYLVYTGFQSATREKTCDAPLVKIGSRCCLDENGDGYCDDRKVEEPIVMEEEQEGVPEEVEKAPAAQEVAEAEQAEAIEEPVPTTVCGNRACEAGEDAYFCPRDCETRKQYGAMLGKITKSQSTSAHYTATSNKIRAFLQAKETLRDLCQPLESCSIYLVIDDADKERLRILVGDKDAVLVYSCTYLDCLENKYPGPHNLTLIIEHEQFIARGSREVDLSFLSGE